LGSALPAVAKDEIVAAEAEEMRRALQSESRRRA
jgi:hypothetical protein